MEMGNKLQTARLNRVTKPPSPQAQYQLGGLAQPQFASQYGQFEPMQQQAQGAAQQRPWADVIADVIREQFGLKPKETGSLYRQPYPEWFERVPLPNQFKVPDFSKFSGQDGVSTYEHISRFLAQCGEASAVDTLKVWLFRLSLSGSAFTWFSSLPYGSINSWADLEKQFHSYFYSGVHEMKLSDLTAIKQWHDEPVHEYIQRFRKMRNKCFSLSLTDAQLADLAFQGMIAPIREKFSSEDFDSLSYLIQKVTLHEHRSAEVRKNSKKVNHVCRYMYGLDDDEDNSEIAAAEWVRSKKVFRQQIQVAIEGGKIRFDDSKKPMKVNAGQTADRVRARGFQVNSAKVINKYQRKYDKQQEKHHEEYDGGFDPHWGCEFFRFCWNEVNQDHGQEDNVIRKNQWCPSGIFTKNQKRRVQRLRNRERLQEVEQEINHRLKKAKPRQEWRVKNQVPIADDVAADEAKRLAKGKSVVTAPVNMVFTLPAEFGIDQADIDEVEEESAKLVLSPEQAVFEKPEGTENRHLKPLYINGYVNGKPMSKMMVDSGAAVNLMPFATFKKLGRNAEDLIKTNMVLIDFGGNPSETKGVLNVELTVGSKTIPTTFFCHRWEGFLQLVAWKGLDSRQLLHSFNYASMFDSVARRQDRDRASRQVRPHQQPPRRCKADMLEPVKAKIKRLYDAGFIRPCRYAEWVSSIVPVIKKNGKVRVCIDFRDLNKATPKDEYPMPVADQLVDAASGNKILSFMDGNAGYNQIFMAKEDIHKTAFRGPGAIGLFEWVVMTFGLKSAGATYQRAMNYIYHDLIGWLVEVYIDDVVVMSKEIEDHIADLRKLLGFLVHERGIEVTQRSVNAIKKIQPPENKTELQEMIDKINFVRRFISNLSRKLEPFTPLLRLKADQQFTWGAEQQKALDNIKEYLSSPPILIPPQKGISFRLYLSAGEKSIGSVLIQELDGKERVVFYLSRRLLDAETRYSPVEKLCLCLYFSCTRLRHYLLSNECTVICKADVVKYMLSAPILKGRVGKWIFSLTEFDLRYESPKAIKGQAIADFIVEHRDDSIGSVEIVPWTLFFDGSVCTHGCGIGLVIISPRGACFELAYTIKPYATNNQAEYEAVLKGLQLLKEVEADAIEIMGDSLLHVSQEQNIEANDLAQGASGYKLMIKDVKVEIAAMTADDWRYYKGCQDCQKFGAIQRAPASAMNPIIKLWPFRGWGIDMIGMINPPSSKGHKFILVATDYFTKWKISDYPRQWHTRLAEALWSYRMACHGSIQVPPYKLVYGHEAILPWEVRIGSRRTELQNDLTADEYYNLMADEREDLVQSRLRALAKVTKDKERVARYYNKKVVPKDFSEGELVWKLILPIGTRDSKFGKWSPNWEGPFQIYKVVSKGAYMLQGLDGEVYGRALNGKYLKKYYPSVWVNA
uniref:Retrotransposon protein, putative, unclassified n=1 Tax=Oryza sativa subsp. japonica TaxID=39947 RepID=Q2QUI5_ORYSJ|nr:retrotransposon protein, putative, unclassified [Oryza sativa Japonica Group]